MNAVNNHVVATEMHTSSGCQNIAAALSFFWALRNDAFITVEVGLNGDA